MTRSIRSETKLKPKEWAFEALGTHWVIEVFDGVVDADNVLHAIMVRIDQFDRNYSRFRADSLVARMAQQAGTYTLPEDAGPMLDVYAELYGYTAGSMTPLIGQTLSDAGYDAAYSLQPHNPEPAADMSDVLSYNNQSITLKQPVLLDFGALGKGHIVDIICNLLHDYGSRYFCVNAGGDMYCRLPDKTSVNVALQHPIDREQAIGITHIHNQALCGSSAHVRTWGDYHHIIDGRTARSPRHITALWVVAASTLLADALSTALFFVTPKTLQTHYNFEYAIIDSHMNLIRSKGFPAEFFGEV